MIVTPVHIAESRATLAREYRKRLGAWGRGPQPRLTPEIAQLVRWLYLFDRDGLPEFADA